MNPARLRRLLPLLVAVALFSVIACLPVRIAGGDDISVTRAREPVAPIVSNVTVSQEFPAKGRAIRSLGLFVSSYGSSKRGTFQVTVDSQDSGRWQPRTSERIPVASLGDTSSDAYVLTFAQPLAVTMDQPVRISVQLSDADPASAITWWSNSDITHDGYPARVNGKQQMGILCFTVSYQPTSARLIQLLGPAWRRVTIFLNPAWQSVLLLGLGMSILSAIAILGIQQRVPRNRCTTARVGSGKEERIPVR
jgi:hypothetical protein